MSERSDREPRDRLIVALDVPSTAEAERLIATLGDEVTFYKVGLELAFCGGLALAERLAADGKKVFLDLKMHDIPATVERAAAQVARLGATFLTVHGFSADDGGGEGRCRGQRHRHPRGYRDDLV